MTKTVRLREERKGNMSGIYTLDEKRRWRKKYFYGMDNVEMQKWAGKMYLWIGGAFGVLETLEELSEMLLEDEAKAIHPEIMELLRRIYQVSANILDREKCTARRVG